MIAADRVITVKGVISEDFIQYKYPSMVVMFPNCSLKCDKECGSHVCQNSEILKMNSVLISVDTIVSMYMNNSITSAIVLSGMDPMDSFEDAVKLIEAIRYETNDTIVIYTGYYPGEITDKLDDLKKFNNIIVKFGRFVPDSNSRFDSLLGINLASDNQFAKTIS